MHECSDNQPKARRESLLTLIAGMTIVAAFIGIYDQFFPNVRGLLGHDYSFFMAYLLDGYFWSTVNGYLSIPWFTPAFCAGSPKFPNFQSSYISLPQILTLVTSPLDAIRWTMWVMGTIGFAGFFLLLRLVFKLDRPSAVLGATLFLFNGLFSHRMMIGHLAFHALMLLPAIALVCALPQKARAANAAAIAAGALMLSYMVVSGMVLTVIPVALTILLLCLCHAVYARQAIYPQVLRLGGSCSLALLICAALIHASLAYRESFPRDLYPLPGFGALADQLAVVVTVLFGHPGEVFGNSRLVNSVQFFMHHEWEYNVTPVPLAVGLLWFLGNAKALRNGVRPGVVSRRSAVLLVAVALILSMPLALNHYSPDWNAFLKRLPLIGNSSLLLRWYLIYIPATILAAALMYHHLRVPGRLYLAALLTVGVVAAAAFEDNRYYHLEAFDPMPIQRTYRGVADGALTPSIGRVHRTDDLTTGASQVYCNDPWFGYRMESFRFGNLVEGSPYAMVAGRYNMRNPACYVYPEENGCRPGDSFELSQREELSRFLAYKPFGYAIPLAQRVANWCSLTSFGITFAFLLFYGVVRLHRSVARRQ